MTRQTSIDTYYQIKDAGLLSSIRLQTYSILVNHGALTAGELMAKAKEDYPYITHQRTESLGRRLSELRDMGCIEEIGIVECSITGRKCIQWAVNGLLPVSGSKRMTNVQRMKKASILIGDYLDNRAGQDNLKEALNILGGIE